MSYNRADTVYFKAAKRLLHIGTKVEDENGCVPEDGDWGSLLDASSVFWTSVMVEWL